MPRPKTKNDLLSQADTNFETLMKYFNSLDDTQRTTSFKLEDRDKNCRDVFAHLYEWHCMMLRWYEEGVVEHGSPEIPAHGYTWRTTADLNHVIWEKYQDTDLNTILINLEETHRSLMDKISSHTQEELFDRNIYTFTKSTTLGAYFISATSSHYDWTLKKIKKQIKALSL